MPTPKKIDTAHLGKPGGDTSVVLPVGDRHLITVTVHGRVSSAGYATTTMSRETANLIRETLAPILPPEAEEKGAGQ